MNDSNTVSINPYVTMGMQFTLTLLALVFLGAGWWFGRIPAETAFPFCAGLISLWISNPVIAAKIPFPLIPNKPTQPAVVAVVKEDEHVR